MNYLTLYQLPPRKGDNVIHLKDPWDFSLAALFHAWREACQTAGEDLIIEKIIIHDWPVHVSNLWLCDLLRSLDETIGVSIFYEKNNQDEWWLLFKDSNLIFYSPGV